MRKRKLYLSELLLRCEMPELAVHIGQPNEMYFDTIQDCIAYIKNTPIWNSEVEMWIQAKWRGINTKWIPTLYIKLK